MNKDKWINNQKGITLVTLIVTVSLLIIIVSVTINVSSNQVETTELKAFYSKMQIAQEGIEKIARTNENYKDSNGNIIYLKDLGDSLTIEQSTLITSLGYSTQGFSCFSAQKIKEILGIHGVDLNLLINFEECIIISEQGVQVDGITYYELEDQKYRVKYSGTKNSGEVDFNYSVEKYSDKYYRIIIEPKNIGDISQGLVKYKETTLNYWKVADDNKIILEELGEYYIMYIDANNNSIQKKLTLDLDAEGNIVSTVEVVE